MSSVKRSTWFAERCLSGTAQVVSQDCLVGDFQLWKRYGRGDLWLNRDFCALQPRFRDRVDSRRGWVSCFFTGVGEDDAHSDRVPRNLQYSARSTGMRLRAVRQDSTTAADQCGIDINSSSIMPMQSLSAPTVSKRSPPSKRYICNVTSSPETSCNIQLNQFEQDLFRIAQQPIKI